MSTKFDFIEDDRRVMEQKLRRHKISKQDYQKHLKGLADDSEFGETLIVCPEEVVPQEEETASATSENL